MIATPNQSDHPRYQRTCRVLQAAPNRQVRFWLAIGQTQASDPTAPPRLRLAAAAQAACRDLLARRATVRAARSARN